MVALARSDNVIDFPQPQGKSNEWYTPARYIEAAREVMGGIDLDPASCELANQTVKAKQYYTQAENGLVQAWYGRVWLNPPFGRVNDSGASKIKMFVTKLMDEYRAGDIEQAILLAPCHIDASWFPCLWEYSICFTNHKVHFSCTHPSDNRHPTAAHMWGTIFAYLGSHEQKFIDVFSQFGRIAKAIDTPRQEVTPIQLWEVQP